MESAAPLVSVCMPAYNAGKYVAQAVESVIRQSYPHWELIIVNDGSTDNTAEVLNTFTDTRIRVYHQPNAGQCAAVNKAYARSKGELIKFLDADDIISQDFIRNQVERIEGRTDVIATASWGRFYRNDLSTFRLDGAIIQQDLEPVEWLVKDMTNKQAMLQCALWLIPRPVLERSGLWNEELSLINDFEFFIRVLLHAREVRFTPEATLYYRSGVAGSLSGLKSAKGALSAYHSIKWGNEHLLNFENSERIRKIAANNFQYLIYSLYPEHSTIIEKAEQQVKELGGANAPFPSGGYTRILSKCLGWKAAKRIKQIVS